MNKYEIFLWNNSIWVAFPDIFRVQFVCITHGLYGHCGQNGRFFRLFVGCMDAVDACIRCGRICAWMGCKRSEVQILSPRLNIGDSNSQHPVYWGFQWKFFHFQVIVWYYESVPTSLLNLSCWKNKFKRGGTLMIPFYLGIDLHLRRTFMVLMDAMIHCGQACAWMGYTRSRRFRSSRPD